MKALLVEQWMPFDLSNQSCGSRESDSQSEYGRFGDWRRAPSDWSVYSPDHDDYQTSGSCRRHIARCLNIGTRLRLLGIEDVREGDVFDATTSLSEELRETGMRALADGTVAVPDALRAAMGCDRIEKRS